MVDSRRRLYEHYAWAWEPYLDVFLRLGWIVVENAHEERSGHPVFIVAWPCDCPVVFPRKGPYK